MSTRDLDEAFQLIDEHDDEADFDGAKSDDLIQRAEQALGLTFPPTYKQFLSRLGCGDIAGAEFYGIIKDDFANSGVPDAIWLTLKQRRMSQLPESLVLVSETGDGGYYGIDVSRKDIDGENPVVEWWPGRPTATGNRRTVASDFGVFLLERVRGSIGN